MNWIFAHLIGDFIIQTDWMAFNKKKNSLACAIHVVVYMIPFLLCGLQWWQLLLIAVQHFAQDRTRFVTWFMKTKGSWKFATGNAAPWSIILTDSILHLVWIYAVIQLSEWSQLWPAL